MKLIAKAKPVKIRIKSGGEEHTSLDSLKKNFNISDIQLLLDGRLVRWLKQQGENELAIKVQNYNSKSLNCAQDIFDFITIFFQEEITLNNIQNLQGLAYYWLENKVFINNAISLKDILINDIEYIKKIYYSRAATKFTTNDWIELFTKLIPHKDAEVLFLLGIILYFSNNEQNKEKGYRYILEAAQLHFEKAIQFINMNKTKYSNISSNTYHHIDKDTKEDYHDIDKSKIRTWLHSNWNSEYCDPQLKNPEKYTEKERELIHLFSNWHTWCQTFKFVTNNKINNYYIGDNGYINFEIIVHDDYYDEYRHDYVNFINRYNKNFRYYTENTLVLGIIYLDIKNCPDCQKEGRKLLDSIKSKSPFISKLISDLHTSLRNEPNRIKITYIINQMLDDNYE